MLYTVGNILHAAGRYDDAKKLLQAAKQRAVKVSRDPRVPQIYTSDDDRIWNWIASYDLALIHLSQGNYAEAQGELRHARNLLRTTMLCPECRGKKDSESIYRFNRYNLAHTEMYLGYASFKQRDYEAAAEGWMAASTNLTHSGLPKSQKLPGGVKGDLTEDIHRLMEDPEHPNSTDSQPDAIVNQMLILHKYAEARSYMERNIVPMIDQPDEGWTARLLVVYLKLHDLGRVDKLFMEHVRSRSGGLNSKAAFAGVVTSLAVMEIYESGYNYEPDFFWDVISRNLYPYPAH